MGDKKDQPDEDRDNEKKNEETKSATRPEMHKRVTKKDDGRSLIYYTFGEAR